MAMVNQDVCQLIYVENWFFKLIMKSSFKKAFESIGNQDRGYVPLSDHETGSLACKRRLTRLTRRTQEWRKTCCQQTSDGWIDRKFKSITNFLLNSQPKTIFLELIATSLICKYSEELFKLFDPSFRRLDRPHYAGCHFQCFCMPLPATCQRSPQNNLSQYTCYTMLLTC